MDEPDVFAPRRRALLAAALGAAAASLGAVRCVAAPPAPVGYHGGRIAPPVPVPDLPVLLANGRSTRLRTLLNGRVTALQLFFTGCSSTCPIQGAVFQRVQALLGAHEKPGVQLLSLSISPLEDTPQRMRAWLARFDARPGWVAAAPELKDVDALQALFGGGVTGLDNHSTQVQVIDRHGALIWRTYALPSAESVAQILRQA
ncbi:SCO family protein [Burkholderia alba]|uniref:SCO family protein n=1 Tax=Burkholderia alba TaxID=2683677 RepID=UPI002B051BAB|nr:SCO family protein [Burkholderia alba]